MIAKLRTVRYLKWAFFLTDPADIAGPQLHEKEQQQKCTEAPYCCMMCTVPCTSLHRSTLLLYDVYRTVHIIAQKHRTAVWCIPYRAHHCTEAPYCCMMYTVPCTSLQRSTLLLYDVYRTVHIIAQKHVTAVWCTLHRAHHCKEERYCCIMYTVQCTSLLLEEVRLPIECGMSRAVPQPNRGRTVTIILASSKTVCRSPMYKHTQPEFTPHFFKSTFIHPTYPQRRNTHSSLIRLVTDIAFHHHHQQQQQQQQQQQ